MMYNKIIQIHIGQCELTYQDHEEIQLLSPSASHIIFKFYSLDMMINPQTSVSLHLGLILE